MSTGEATNKGTMFLITANQYFTECTGVSISEIEADASGATYTEWIQMTGTTYGQLWGFYHFLKAEAGSVKIGLQVPDRIIFVGALLGVGTAFSWTLGVGANKYKTTGSLLTELFTETAGGVSSGNKAVIAAPANGVGQFKGLSTSTPVTKYNQVICKSIMPFYATNYPQNLVAGAGNGWYIQCYTGIAQC